MRNTFSGCTSAAFAAIALISIGCNSTPPTPKPVSLPAATAPSTQPDEVVAELSTLQITRKDLDTLLYQAYGAYGLRTLFDLVELDLAKDTLQVRRDLAKNPEEAKQWTITPQDIDRERQSIIKGIVGPDAPESSYDDLVNQFLQNEHLSRAEFEVKIVQTDAYLRKIVTPLVVGKLPEPAVRRGFEQLYGAKRQIADIELQNVREAVTARDRLNKKEPFAQVAHDMSIDTDAAKMGGQWQAFSTQSMWVPQAIRDAAFSMEKGEMSDIIQAEGKYHIIQLIAVIDPKIVKFEDVKDDVRKQMEDQLITLNMKQLRKELSAKAQQQLRYDDPILKSQWDALVEQQQGKTHDRESALKKLNEDHTRETTRPAATQP